MNAVGAMEASNGMSSKAEFETLTKMTIFGF